jgi:flagellin-specific chaperone FliS
MTELSTSLKHEANASLCATLSDLYEFFTREFSEAFAKYDPNRIRAILPLIRELRNAWVAADKRAGQIQFATA